jgi:DNA-binding XRE family transcriptional regulator
MLGRRRRKGARIDVMNEPFREPKIAIAPLDAGGLGERLDAGLDGTPDGALALAQLRKRCAMTQEKLAEKLAIGRPAVCKLERRGDMHVSNLRRYVEALGGTLAITAHFPDGAVMIADLGGA